MVYLKMSMLEPPKLKGRLMFAVVGECVFGLPSAPLVVPGTSLAPLASSSSVIGFEVKAVSMLGPSTPQPHGQDRVRGGCAEHNHGVSRPFKHPAWLAENPDSVPCSLASRM